MKFSPSLQNLIDALRCCKLALETGRTIEITHEDKTYTLGQILDPVALMATLEQ